MPRLRCWIFGHEEDPEAAYYGSDYSCRWCGFHDAYLPVATFRWQFWGLVPHLLRPIGIVKAWLLDIWRQTGKCPYCGEREGWGHSPDCIPF